MNGNALLPRQPPKKNFFSKRSKLEIFLTASLLCVVLYLILDSLFSIEAQNSEHCNNIDCYKAVIEIAESVDPSKDPCVDFHDFACGNFLKNYKKDSSVKSNQEMVNQELEAFIVEPINEDDPLFIQIQKEFFKACSDEEAIDLDENGSFFVLLEELGGWPVLKGVEWNEEDFDWMDLLIKCKELGLPFNWFLEIDVYRSAERNYLKISYPDNCFNLELSYPEYIELLIETAVAMLGSRANAISELSQVLQFEKNLKEICDKGVDDDSTIATIKEIQYLYPKFNWLEFFGNITNSEEVTEDTEIAWNIKSFINLDFLLIRTSKRVQSNYIIWKIIQHFGPYLSTPIRELFSASSKYKNRDDFCVDATSSKFKLVRETEFIRKYTTDEAKAVIEPMFNYIKQEFKTRIENSNWIPEELKSFLLETLPETRIIIGAPEQLIDEEFFNNNFLHIGELNFSSTNIIEMITERSKSYHNSLIGSISQPGFNTETKKFLLHDILLDFYYDTTQNIIVVPAAALNGFSFASNRPYFLNYASLGNQIGYYLSQSINMFATESNFSALLLNEITLAFEGIDDCFKRNSEIEYNNSVNVNEIFGEFVGEEVAYAAYQTWSLENSENEKFLDITYSSEQLYWIKSSLQHCRRSFINNEDKMQSYNNKYINLVITRNSEEFSKDFDCPVGSPMNPEKKCRIL